MQPLAQWPESGAPLPSGDDEFRFLCSKSKGVRWTKQGTARTV